MATPYPRSGSDLALAPVLIRLEQNLELLRTARSIPFELALELNDDERSYPTPQTRAARLLRAATRNVNLHGLTAASTADLNGLSVSHGEYRVSLMLGARLADYVRSGAATALTSA